MRTARIGVFEEGLTAMKYLFAWLVGVPTSLIVLWFVANQVGCGF